MPRELQDSRVKPMTEGDGRFWDHCERGAIVVRNKPGLSRWWCQARPLYIQSVDECSVRDHIANCSTKTDLYGTSVHTRIRRGRKTDKGDDKTDIGQNIPAHMYIGIQQNQRNANRDGTGLAACAPWSAMEIGIGITEPRSKDGLFACILTRTCSSTTAILDICAR